MNFSGPLSHIHICESCGGEGYHGDMSEEHAGLCRECAKDLQAELDAESTETLLTDSEVAAVFSEEARVLPAGIVKVLDEPARHARKLLGERFSSRAS